MSMHNDENTDGGVRTEGSATSGDGTASSTAACEGERRYIDYTKDTPTNGDDSSGETQRVLGFFSTRRLQSDRYAPEGIIPITAATTAAHAGTPSSVVDAANHEEADHTCEGDHFAAAPADDATDSDSAIHGQVQVRPGAVAVVGIGSQRSTSDYDNLTVGSGTRTEAGETSSECGDLAVAHPVMDGEDDIPTALQQEQGERKRTQRWSWYRQYLLVGLLVLIGIIATVVAFLGSNGPIETAAPSFSPTENPTASNSPSAAPSFSTTEDFLLSLLPNYTVTTIAQDLNRTSPQAMAFDWLRRHPNITTTYSDWRINQRFALATFYFATGGLEPNRWDFEDWIDRDEHECNWQARGSLFVWGDSGRIAIARLNASLFEAPCDIGWHQELHTWEDRGVFQNLWLWGINLRGTIPPQIGLLTDLRSINLDPSVGDIDVIAASEPDAPRTELWLTGAIPTEIGLCTNLQIVTVQANYFDGTVPTALGALFGLHYLRLPFNDFVGAVPSQLGLLSNLEFLDLSVNSDLTIVPSELSLMTALQSLNLRATGISSLPAEFGLMTSLQWMDLSWCLGLRLTTDFFLMTSLLSLDLAFIRLTSIPSELGMMTSLTWLGLQDNKLAGPIPSQLGRLTNLISLRLSEGDAEIPVQGLTGTIPTQIGLMTMLDELVLSWRNDLTGTIPSQIGLMTSVGKLTLRGNLLAGTVPTELGLLANATWLELGENAFTGTIPSEIGLLTLLQALSLAHRPHELTHDTPLLSGQIPSQIWQLTSLTALELTGNRLSGPVPVELRLLSSLEELYLDNNFFSGSLPTEIGLLRKAIYMDLSHNLFLGSVPTQIGMLETLVSLYLSENSQFSGIVPSEIGMMTNLERLELSHNNHSGWIPSEIWELNNFTALDARANYLFGEIPPEIGNWKRGRDFPYPVELLLDDNLLSGSIPSEFGLLAALDGIALGRNHLSGILPTELGMLKGLTSLRVHNNHLSGPIASEIGKLPRLLLLDLGDNQLSGLVPSEIGNMSLFELDIHQNLLSGTIPSEIGSAGADWLDVSENFLSGAIPSEIFSRGLRRLRLNNNNLSETIPSDIGVSVYAGEVWLHNNNLSGPIPTETGLLTRLQSLKLNNNTFSGTVPTELGAHEFEYWISPPTISLEDNLLEGRIPQSLCALGPTNLSFDCNPNLCGCWCPCLNGTALRYP